MIVATLRTIQILRKQRVPGNDVADEVRHRGDNVAADRDWLMTLVCLQV